MKSEKSALPYIYHITGKLQTDSLKPLNCQEDLSLAYTPGVAEPCRKIQKDPSLANAFTSKSHTVAVVTDGTAVLGLGDIGPGASIPVMEGKCVLFKKFAGLDAFPIALNHMKNPQTGRTDVEQIVSHIKALTPVFGGINLEDIAAPECFEIERRLEEELDIPVFHDDQWGTAIITLAAIRNYLFLSGKSIEKIKIVINGAGAAGIRIADMLKADGARCVIMVDRRGVITQTRKNLPAGKTRHSINPAEPKYGLTAGKPLFLEDALSKADVFIGVSAGNCVTEDMICSMNDFPAIFAMANPVPEIHPDKVRLALDGKPHIMATGRSDFPNQINNVLGFPFIFKGALMSGAKKITTGMKKAAAAALAELARKKDIPESVKKAYRKDFTFGTEYIIPTPFDPRIDNVESHSVARAALEEGVSVYSVSPQDFKTFHQEGTFEGNISGPGYCGEVVLRFKCCGDTTVYALPLSKTFKVFLKDGNIYNFSPTSLDLSALNARLSIFHKDIAMCKIYTEQEQGRITVKSVSYLQ